MYCIRDRIAGLVLEFKNKYGIKPNVLEMNGAMHRKLKDHLDRFYANRTLHPLRFLQFGGLLVQVDHCLTTDTLRVCFTKTCTTPNLPEGMVTLFDTK